MQLLDQCTVRLGLASAARRLYTCCGELITDVQQLIRPYAMRNEQDNETETQQQIASFDSKANKVGSVL